jgi:hypothetical protein
MPPPPTTTNPPARAPAGPQVGKEKMHFRPPEEQNDHKVTCGVNVSVLQPVLDSIQQRINSAGVQANIITSGTGEGVVLGCVVYVVPQWAVWGVGCAAVCATPLAPGAWHSAG